MYHNEFNKKALLVKDNNTKSNYQNDSCFFSTVLAVYNE
nr:MAG TPA: hypothetical protein [Caudoviricetes sp.]